MSNAVERPVCPWSSRNRNRSFVSAADPNPANWRIVHSRPRYIDGIDAAGERELARVAQVALEVDLDRVGGRERGHVEAGQRREELAAAIRRASASLAPALEPVRRGGCHFSPDPTPPIASAARPPAARASRAGGPSRRHRRPGRRSPSTTAARQPWLSISQPPATLPPAIPIETDGAEPRERLGHRAGGGDPADLAVQRRDDRRDREPGDRTGGRAIAPIDVAASGRAISP